MVEYLKLESNYKQLLMVVDCQVYVSRISCILFCVLVEWLSYFVCFVGGLFVDPLQQRPAD